MNIYYRDKFSRLIVAKYIGCDTRSTVFSDVTRYERFENPHNLPLESNPPYNPVSIPQKLFLQSPNNDLWELSIDNEGKITMTKHPYIIGDNERTNYERFAQIMANNNGVKLK